MLANGSVLQNRYLIKRLLAQGGMGAVYEAEAIQLGGVAIALKQTLFGEDRKFLRDQFQLEAKVLARLKHRALPRVSDHSAFWYSASAARNQSGSSTACFAA